MLEVKMATKSTHEPRAKVMSATDVWDDAREIASVLRHKLILQKHIETRLAS